MSRSRYSDEDKARLLGEFDACGGSAAAFCRDRGLAYQTSIAWRRGTAGRRDAGNTMEFVELALGPVAGERTATSPQWCPSPSLPRIERLEPRRSRCHSHMGCRYPRPSQNHSSSLRRPWRGDGTRSPAAALLLGPDWPGFPTGPLGAKSRTTSPPPAPWSIPGSS